MIEYPQSEILRTSRDFFHEIVSPILSEHFPDVFAQAACGFFGYGSECLGMDDDYSRDHHFGLRVNMLLPGDLADRHRDDMLEVLSRELPTSLPEKFHGFGLRQGHVKGAGVAPESLEGFLTRTIGRQSAPMEPAHWLDMPEEDIVHVINGDVWHDPLGRFTAVREALQAYYPDDVWRRRVAHWCRCFSGFGLYALHRAVLRGNHAYATTALGRTTMWTMQLAFLLAKTYYPYDKWLYPMFQQLGDPAPQLLPLVDRITAHDCAWDERITLFHQVSDVLDAKMVDLGLVDAHPKYKGSATSGYRLIEHHYTAILKTLSPEMARLVPMMEQRHLEVFHSEFVQNLDMADWHAAINLSAD